MARPLRIQYDGACYHIYHRGNRRETIFCQDADYSRFEAFLIEAMNWSGVLVYDWSLMPNHFHLLVQTPNGNLAEFMQRLLTRYAMYFNWKHEQVGHVFQGRYQARLCDKEQYFLDLVRYVELNPYRTKHGPLAALGDWKWSSLRYYMGLELPPEGFQRPMEEVLTRFGATLETARKNLASFLVDGLKQGTWEDFYRSKDWRFLGGEEFVERVKQKALEPIRQNNRRLRKLTGISDLAFLVEACFGIQSSELASPRKDRRLSRIRQAMVEVGRREYRIPVKALARHLRRSGSAISMLVRRQWDRGIELPETRQLLGFLQEPSPPEIQIPRPTQH